MRIRNEDPSFRQKMVLIMSQMALGDSDCATKESTLLFGGLRLLKLVQLLPNCLMLQIGHSSSDLKVVKLSFATTISSVRTTATTLYPPFVEKMAERPPKDSSVTLQVSLFV
jgi:hypothetical protein